ncbi:MAG: acyltransferase [Vicinamibacteria bacterium]
MIVRRLRIALLMGASFLPSGLQRVFYRWFMGAHFGPNVRIGFLSIVNSRGAEIGSGTVIEGSVRIDAKTVRILGNCRIGRNVRIRASEFVMAWRSIVDESTSIQGDLDDVRSRYVMGMHSWVFPRCTIDLSRPVLLGRNAGIGGESLLFTHGQWLSQLHGFPVTYGAIQIKDDVWIPWSCFIMPGVTLGSRVVVGAGSIVTRSLAAGVLAAGVPAKVLREVSSKELSIEERQRLIGECVASYANRFGLTVQTTEREEGIVHSVSDKPFIAYVTNAVAARDLWSRGIMSDLTLVDDAIDPDHSVLDFLPICSVANGLCSRERALSANALAFLLHARKIGFRYYPVDEYLESERLLGLYRGDPEQGASERRPPA